MKQLGAVAFSSQPCMGGMIVYYIVTKNVSALNN